MAVSVEYFPSPGPKNTQTTLAMAIKRAKELGLRKLVLASTHGSTARAAQQLGKDAGLEVIAVTISPSFKKEGWAMTDNERKGLEALGIKVLTCLHALADGVNEAFGEEHTPGSIIADTLRCFSHGTKVAVEVAIMALEAGLIEAGETIVALGGTNDGCDTALALKPTFARKFKDLRVLEFICKPREA